jgi:DHA2 family multidrug resistance protein
MAAGRVYRTFMQQVAVLAYSDVFFQFAILAFLAVPLCFLLSGKTASGAPGGAH